MRSRRRLVDVLVLTVVSWALFVPAAHAYIDAGSVSVVFQAVVAGIAAGWMFVKLFWQRIRRFFSRSSDQGVEDTPAAAGPEGAGTSPEAR